MSNLELLARCWREKRLYSVLLELTYRCDLNCLICYNDASDSGKALGLSQYESLLEDLEAMGTVELTLSGGEPMAHPHFFKIGARARALGFTIRLKTNGSALTSQRLRRLQHEVDPWLLEVSLHGARSETHDRQTQVPEGVAGHLRSSGFCPGVSDLVSGDPTRPDSETLRRWELRDSSKP